MKTYQIKMLGEAKSVVATKHLFVSHIHVARVVVGAAPVVLLDANLYNIVLCRARAKSNLSVVSQAMLSSVAWLY